MFYLLLFIIVTVREAITLATLLTFYSCTTPQTKTGNISRKLTITFTITLTYILA